MPKIKLPLCTHDNYSPICIHTNNIFICQECSSIIYILETKTKISTIKPIDEYNKYTEIIPSFYIIGDESRQKEFIDIESYLKIRREIIKEMKKIVLYFSLSKKTFFLAVDYFDRICSKMSTYDKSTLEQICHFCIILSCKFQENCVISREVENFLKNIISSNYAQDEIYLLNLLNYDLNIITSYDILIDFMHYGFFFESENFSLKQMNIVYNNIINMLYFLSETKLYLEMSPKRIILSIIGFIRECLGVEPFSNLFKKIFNVNDKDDENSFLIIDLLKIKQCLKLKKNDKKTEKKFKNELINNNNDSSSKKICF